MRFPVLATLLALWSPVRALSAPVLESPPAETASEYLYQIADVVVSGTFGETTEPDPKKLEGKDGSCFVELHTRIKIELISKGPGHVFAKGDERPREITLRNFRDATYEELKAHGKIEFWQPKPAADGRVNRVIEYLGLSLIAGDTVYGKPLDGPIEVFRVRQNTPRLSRPLKFPSSPLSPRASESKEIAVKTDEPVAEPPLYLFFLTPSEGGLFQPAAGRYDTLGSIRRVSPDGPADSLGIEQIPSREIRIWVPDPETPVRTPVP